MTANPNRSFAPDSSTTVTLESGQVAHRNHVEQSRVLERRLYTVRPGVHTLVGNGLSNQTFIEAPEGVIAIDTGESVEEMRDAIAELRTVCDRPIVAVLYTHFHYVGGTPAVFADGAAADIPIWAHERVAYNRARTASEISPAYSRGLVEQFAINLPESGPDGRVNVGLGHFYRNPAHAPFTSVFVPPTHTFGATATISVAGLDVLVTLAPSDADDSVTYWFPDLAVAVHNLVWPVLFNIFAIRGEEYRDPRVLLTGIDHLLSLGADHLVAAHGPPMSGADQIRDRVTRYRDSIQFLWDQSVRHINRGVLAADLGHVISLPDRYDQDFVTAERYGVSEHHVRQIRNGLFGFFDGDESQLFPLPSTERADRMIAGFGGRAKVRNLVLEAIDADDIRWATEMATWLARSTDAEQEDRNLLARAVRIIGQRSPAANIRSWCLTRALSLEGAIDTSRLYQHRFGRQQVISSPIERSVHVLRVLVDPDELGDVDVHVGWNVGSGVVTGLHFRNGIACPTDGVGCTATVTCSIETWADLLTGRARLSASVESDVVRLSGDATAALAALRACDPEGLRS